MEKGDRYNTSDTQVIIAALNEEEGIGNTITELQECLNYPRILVVDGRSKDDTVHAAKTLGADVIFQEGMGKGDAISCGLKFIGTKSKYVVLTDADYTYPAKHIPQMIEIIEQNPDVGMVCGNRFNSTFGSEEAGDVFYIGNKLLASAQQLLNGVYLKDPLTGLRVVRSHALKNWNLTSKEFDIEVELNFAVQYRGFRIIETPIAYRRRLGEKKLKMADGFSIFKRILSQSVYPY